MFTLLAKVWVWLDGKKTYFVAGLTLVYAISGFLLHYLDGQTAITLILGALGLSSLRHALPDKV